LNWQEKSLERSEKPRDASPEFAGFGRRFLAMMIDFLIVYLLMLPGYSILMRSEASSARTAFDILFSIFGISFNIWNNVYLVSRDGASLGKKALGIAILDGSFRRLTLLMAFARLVVKAISALPFWLGFFWMMWDSKRQTWHDKFVGSYVYRSDSLGTLADQNEKDRDN
jgi:uncharacterized RDD family membrane protein YckC